MKQHNKLGDRRRQVEQLYLTERQFLKFAVGSEDDNVTKHQITYAKFEALEEKLAHCYFMLHQRFITDPTLSRFWLDTALDELQHQSILRFCRERTLTADADVGLDRIEKIEDLLDTVQGIVNDPDVSIDEAFYASLLMESSELDDVYEKLTGLLKSSHPVLYDAIRASLRSHHETFAEAVEKFSGDHGLAQAFRNLGRAVS